MRLAIVAAPPLVLVTAMTLGLALRAHHAAPPASPISARFETFDVVLETPPLSCETAHALIVRGHITGGASHVQLAGPILYTNISTNAAGDFELRVPVDGNVCDLLTQPTSYLFGEDVSYTITFE